MKNFIFQRTHLFLFLITTLAFLYFSFQTQKNSWWYRNPDHDSSLVVDALRYNSRELVNFTNNPGIGSAVIVGALLRVGDFVGAVDISDYKILSQMENPLLAYPDIFLWLRYANKFLYVLAAWIVGLCAYELTGRNKTALYLGATTFLLSSGSFYLSLFPRTDFHAVTLAFLSFYFLLRSLRTTEKPALWFLIGAGGLAGWSVLCKVLALPVVFLFLVYFLFRRFQNPTPHTQSKRSFVFTCVLASMIYLIYAYFMYTPDRMPSGVRNVGFLPIVFMGLSLWLEKKDARKALVASSAARFFSSFVVSLFLIGWLVVEFKYTYKHREALSTLFSFYALKQPLWATNLARDGVFASIVNLWERFWVPYGWEQWRFLWIAAVFWASFYRRNYLPIFILLAGALMAFVVGIRYFIEYYLIYIDAFMFLAVALALYKERQFFALIFVALCVSQEWRVIHDKYLAGTTIVDSVYENDIKTLPGMFAHPDFKEMFLNRYKSEEGMYREVFCNPKLNGSEDGIDLKTQRRVGDLMISTLSKQPCDQ